MVVMLQVMQGMVQKMLLEMLQVMQGVVQKMLLEMLLRCLVRNEDVIND